MRCVRLSERSGFDLTGAQDEASACLIDAADATFATDNFAGGQQLGRWTRTQHPWPVDARIALLNVSPQQPPVDG